MKKNPLLTLSILSSVLLGISSASATILVPGPGAFPPDPFVATGAETLLASLTSTDSFTTTAGTTTFTTIRAVYSDPLNIFGAGDLDFVYQLSNSANSASGIARLSATSFAGFFTDVGLFANGGTLTGAGFVDGTVPPQLVDRLTAAVVGFNYTVPIVTPIAAGQTSNVMVIETNATRFTAGNFSVIDGGSFTGAAFQPALAPVPDSGSTAILLGFGMIGLFAAYRALGWRSLV